VNLHLDKVRFPDGQIIPEYHLIDIQIEAVGVIVTDEEQRLLMVRAYRYPTDSVDWEIPAGGIDPGEDPIQAGVREVREESGVEINLPEYLYRFHPMNGSCNKVFHLVRAQARTAGTDTFDRNEIAETAWFDQESVRQMLAENAINDGYTLAALLWVLGSV
jgi:ADP-ribose pyrophosphatase